MRSLARHWRACFAVLALLVCRDWCGPAEALGHPQATDSHPIDLPAPAGPYRVATKIFHWTDLSRREKAGSRPHDFRQLVVQVWYPTNDDSGLTAPYVPMLPAYRQVWEQAEVTAASLVTTHSRWSKPPLAGLKLPIVLFSHGWQGTRSEYTSIAEELASRGYAVFGIDHPYMGRVALPDGRVTEPSEDQFGSPAEIKDWYGRDVRFAIDEIVKLNETGSEGAFGRALQPSRIAAIGHSSGFVAAGTACKLDQRISACVNVDAPGFSALQLTGLDQPLLWIRLERAGPVPEDFLNKRRSTIYELQIAGANHGSIEDWDYLEAGSSLDRKRAGARLARIRNYLGAFLGKHLQGQDAGLLQHNASDAEFTLRVYRPRRD